ncbi:hypothetical protein LCGC14_1859130 [marine sediment metagenome]|uniref:Tyr recombinase domain-containing protein n=1 Tax=marine sediment metagenome TaxID=412755 RepID=A0A0F9G8B0_9ZZZZ
MKIPIDLFENYLKNKGLKERTIENYIYYFNKFIHNRFNQESISKFLASPSNRNSIGRSFLVNLKKFLTMNRIELKIDQDYYNEIVEVELPSLTGRVKQTLVKPIPHGRIPLLEEALETEKLKLQLLITYYGALRLGEMLKIRILSFDWDEWKKDTSKWGECRVFGKGDKEGIALIPPDLMKRIARYIRSHDFLEVHGYLFIKESEKQDIKNRARIWQKNLRNAGIKSGITKLDNKREPVQGTRVYPHRLRHSYAFHLLKDKKIDIRYIQEVLRHTSIRSTQIYTLITKEELKRKMEEIDKES